MKKTLLITSLVASMVVMAGTTGSVEGYNENEANFEKGKPATFVAKKLGVKTEVKVNETGFSFGGEFKAEELALGGVKKANYLDHSNVWVKYELPELKGVKTYVKATVSPKFTELEKLEKEATDVIKVKEDKGSAELEGQVSYKYGDFTFGLNSKTNFPLSNKEYKYPANGTDPTYDGTEEYGKLVKSTHKVFVESEKDKDVFVKGLKDVKANVEIKHNYAKEVTKVGDRVDYVKGNVELAYDGIKDLRMDGKIDFTVNVNGSKELGNTKLGDYNLKDIELGEEASKEPVDLVHTYNAKLTYTGVKGLTLAVAPFVSHIKKVDTIDIVMYGSSLNAKYKMLNDQLTLTGKALLEGDSELENGVNKQNLGVVSLGANAKYDYKVSDKFTVSPEADAKLELLIANHQTVPYLTLTPKVSVEYKPTDTLTLKGSVEVPVKFEIEDAISKNFEYKQTQLKTSLNLKYEWK
ncbi:hypothetical protein ABZU05_06030 [Sneathia vaginalis]|uniref:hypothetical protein n=1 Tax=Sneathia vaginalis TaxID=187101 RepID=UPI0035C67142